VIRAQQEAAFGTATRDHVRAARQNFAGEGHTLLSEAGGKSCLESNLGGVGATWRGDSNLGGVAGVGWQRVGWQRVADNLGGVAAAGCHPSARSAADGALPPAPFPTKVPPICPV
jgi:hypothetical protein